MPATLNVILTTDVDKLGRSGELVKVRPGFARNFLVPRGMAVSATESAINQLEHKKAVALAQYEKAKKEAQATATKIAGLHLKIARPVGEDGKLFGAVSSKEIEAAAKDAGVTIDKKKLGLKEAIKALGVVEIPVKLFADVSATLKVEVLAKK